MRNDVRIARGVDLWMGRELELAGDTVNKMYSDFEAVVGAFAFPPGDERNTIAEKSGSHASRFNNNGGWFESFSANPNNEKLRAKMIFACLMRVSGARKNIGYAVSSDQDEFADMIANSGNFGATRLIIAQEISNLPDTVTEEKMRSVNNTLQAVNTDTFQRMKLGRDGLLTEGSAVAAHDFHRNALQTLVAYATYTGGDNLQTVPALEPITITKSLDMPIIYPFSDEVLETGYTYLP